MNNLISILVKMSKPGILKKNVYILELKKFAIIFVLIIYSFMFLI